MTHKTLLLSASVFCLSLLSGSALAVNPAAFSSQSPAAAHSAAHIIMPVNAETGSSSASGSVKSPASRAAANLAEKRIKGTKSPSAASTLTHPSAKTVKEPKATKLLRDVKQPQAAKTAKEKAGMFGAAKNKTGDKAALSTGTDNSKPKREKRSYTRHTKKAVPAAAGMETAGSAPMRRRGTTADTYQRTERAEHCVCTEGFYCIGPRGGHYCYTSGGNKRYVKHH